MDNSIAAFHSPPRQTKNEVAALPRLLKPADAARILEIDDKTLVRWARIGYVPAHPMGQGQGKRRMWRFYEHELIAWARSQTNSAKNVHGRAA